jgi:hypothetical protein
VLGPREGGEQKKKETETDQRLHIGKDWKPGGASDPKHEATIHSWTLLPMSRQLNLTSPTGEKTTVLVLLTQGQEERLETGGVSGPEHEATIHSWDHQFP